MKRDNIKKRLAAAMVTGSLVLSMSVPAIAQDKRFNNKGDNRITVSAKKNILKKGNTKLKKHFLLDLNKYVQEKIITQQQADKITAFMKKRADERKALFDKMKDMSREEKREYIQKYLKQKEDILTQLVNEKIITEQQADKIRESRAKAAAARMEEKRLRFEQKLKEEVSKGTITQEQSDKINTFIKQQFEARKAEMKKLQTMSEEQRKEYFKNNPRKHTDIFSDLVSSKITTEEQKKALIKTFQENNKMEHEKNMVPKTN